MSSDDSLEEESSYKPTTTKEKDTKPYVSFHSPSPVPLTDIMEEDTGGGFVPSFLEVGRQPRSRR